MLACYVGEQTVLQALDSVGKGSCCSVIITDSLRLAGQAVPVLDWGYDPVWSLSCRRGTVRCPGVSVALCPSPASVSAHGKWESAALLSKLISN